MYIQVRLATSDIMPIAIIVRMTPKVSDYKAYW